MSMFTKSSIATKNAEETYTAFSSAMGAGNSADLIVGYKSSGYVLSVVDRKSKLTVLRKLRTKKKSTVQKQITQALGRLGRVFTLTVDNGTEFYDHENFPVRV